MMMGYIDPANSRYEKKDGLYQYYLGDTLMAEADRIAVAFALVHDKDRGTWTVIKHKHGIPDSVWTGMLRARDQFTGLHLQHIADEFCVVESNQWDVADLNEVVHDSEYLESLLLKVGFDLGELAQLGLMRYTKASPV